MDPPYNWSVEDKRELLRALRRHGESDLEALRTNMPHIPIAEVRNMLDYYKKRAQSKWLSTEKRTTDEITKWIDIMDHIRSKQRGRIHDILPRALKYIALFEKTSKESDIILSEAYSFLSEVCNAKPTIELPERTGYFLYQCLVRMAENFQEEDTEQAQSYLKDLENFQDLLKKSDQSFINPLSVPDNLLQMASVETGEGETQ